MWILPFGSIMRRLTALASSPCVPELKSDTVPTTLREDRINVDDRVRMKPGRMFSTAGQPSGRDDATKEFLRGAAGGVGGGSGCSSGTLGMLLLCEPTLFRVFIHASPVTVERLEVGLVQDCTAEGSRAATSGRPTSAAPTPTRTVLSESAVRWSSFRSMRSHCSRRWTRSEVASTRDPPPPPPWMSSDMYAGRSAGPALSPLEYSQPSIVEFRNASGGTE
mmetsp:Transcript_43297/g.134680  ORF Transcript_43297/g.134680 Transcript_43297/m.134680 type:complete len:221 (+) Transcript_43297:55-717(+)